MRYASKAYMGKAVETPPGWEHVWGSGILPELSISPEPVILKIIKQAADRPPVAPRTTCTQDEDKIAQIETTPVFDPERVKRN
jgi:hypothetical protein